MNIERFDGADVEVVAERRMIVTALPLKREARDRLADLLQARIIDIRDPFGQVDLVVTPPCSPQLIGALNRKYPDARIVVVELDDWEFDIASTGPVKRILRAGADAYVLADSLDELARKLAVRSDSVHALTEPGPVGELAASATVDELIAAFLRESIEYSTHLRPDGR